MSHPPTLQWRSNRAYINDLVVATIEAEPEDEAGETLYRYEITGFPSTRTSGRCNRRSHAKLTVDRAYMRHLVSQREIPGTRPHFVYATGIDLVVGHDLAIHEIADAAGYTVEYHATLTAWRLRTPTGREVLMLWSRNFALSESEFRQAVVEAVNHLFSYDLPY